MKRYKSAKEHALPSIIAISIITPLVITLSIFFLTGIVKYFFITVCSLVFLLFLTSGIKEIKSGKNWLLRLDDKEIEFESPASCSFTMSLEDIDFISVGGTQKGNSKKYTTYIIHTVDQEEIILPKVPWDMFPVKIKLKKLGVKFKSKKS